MSAGSRLYRASAALSAAIVLAMGVAACGGSSPKSTVTPSSFNPVGERRTQLVAALGRCFIDHHLIPGSVLSNMRRKNGQVDTYDPGFQSWAVFDGDSVTYQKKAMGDWIDQAVADGKTWPTSLCGPIPSPSAAP